MEEAYSPTDTRSFTPPPPGISKFSQPILDKVSDITIPANLQEILANVKRQEISKVDSYLPSKPSATFLTSVNSGAYQKSEKYTPGFAKTNTIGRLDKSLQEIPTPPVKETKSTLRSLSDMDLIKKAEEELAAVAAATASIQNTPILIPPPFTSPTATNLAGLATSVFPGLQDPTPDMSYPPPCLPSLPEKKLLGTISEQPKPPGLEDEELPVFPSVPPPHSSVDATRTSPPRKFVPKSGIVLSVKRKMNDDGSPPTVSTKSSRTKSRWGQGPTD